MAPRVAYLVRRYPLLSQTFVRNEVDEARRQGLDVFIVSLEPGDVGEGAAPDLLVDGRWSEAELDRAARHFRRRHPLRWRRFRETSGRLLSELGRGTGRVDARTIPALALDLQRRRIDVLHAHFGWHGAVAAWLVSTLIERPWSMTLHANDIFARRRNLEEKCAAADRVITVCDYNRRWLRDELGIDRDIDLVVCGVHADVDVAGDDRDVDVLAVGRLVEKKGIDVLVRAAAQVVRQRPSLRVEIIGDGPLRADLEALRDDLGLGGTVRFTGALPHDDVLARMRAARLFALPCRIATDGDRDSMPVVIKEAMAREIPVVATDEVAVPEMIDDTCGRLVAVDDEEGLAAALTELLDDPALARDLGRAARRRVIESFGLTGEVAKLVAVFEQLAGAPASVAAR